MKKLFLFSLLLFTVLSLRAQVTFNPKIGVNASGLDARIDDFRSEARAGWNAGFDLRIGERMVFFQPGVHIYNMNAQLSQEPGLDDVNFLQDQTTIQLVKFPVNMGIRLTGTNGLLNIYALAGVTPTLLAGVRESSSFSLTEDDINDFTYGANIGAGVDLFFLSLDVRYEVGLNDFYSNSPGRNNILTANVGIRF
ncbi:MAG TPA: outer membrane beta-barrel protein [Saprospiraceae bacterium]|nr:outer membrane beta-barrel protein [Saprospiraceae bacterium]